MDILPQLEGVLVAKGEKVSRPVYDQALAETSKDKDEEDDDEDDDVDVKGKKNHEATSDEED